ncbi:MAG: LuxR C-terminal-related transcriptional regulator [Desulfovermiculus sp.]
MRLIRRMQGTGPLRVVVSHENITQLKLVQEELESKEAALARQTEELREANAALKALLRQRDQDRKEIEANVLETVKQEVLPHIRELDSSPLNTRQQVLVRHIETTLQDIVSPFARSLSTHFASLTPQEMRVASLIRQGMSSKEIAQALQCSEYAVLFHRKNLRSKLGLTNKGVNLYSFLQTFSDWEE